MYSVNHLGRSGVGARDEQRRGQPRGRDAEAYRHLLHCACDGTWPRLDLRAKSVGCKYRELKSVPFITCRFCAGSCLPGHYRFPAEIARNSLPKTASSTLFFSGNFNAFHRTKTEPISTTCQGDIHVAREEHHVSTGTLGTEIKPTPRMATTTEFAERPSSTFPSAMLRYPPGPAAGSPARTGRTARR